MKLATLFTAGSHTALHLQTVDGYQLVDRLAAQAGLETLRGLNDVGELYGRGPSVLDQLRGLATDDVTDVAHDQARFAPPVLRPGKIICVGLNYLAHIEESGQTKPERQVLFAKYPSCLVGHDADVVIPPITNEVDYEGELAVIIAARAKGLSAAEAMSAVGGFTIINDVSARDLQSAEPQWIRGKALDTFAPLGPVVLDVRSAPPIGEMRIVTIINGEVRQNALCALMITSVPELIAYISEAITLEPGDIIATGTPAGVALGMDPPVYLQPGDVMTVEIAEIGVLGNPLVGTSK